MGIGYWLSEKLIFDKDSGQLLTHNTWVGIIRTGASSLDLKQLQASYDIIILYNVIFLNMQEYKPPSSKDIPIDFRVELLKDAPNPIGVLGSKGAYDIDKSTSWEY